MAAEAVDAILAVWKGEAPLRFDGRFWQFGLEDNVWKRHGVGLFPKPLQSPHPPLAMAMVGHASGSARVVAERDMIPISANFIPVADVASHWRVYAETRAELGLPIDRSVWRIARNVLVADSDAEAAELKADPDGPFAFYFRYLKSLRRIPELRDRQEAPAAELNPILEVDQAIRESVIAGSAASVLDGLVAMRDETGDFGVLLLAAHDWDETGRWQRSMARMAEDVMPRFEQHVRATPAAAD
jgi:alkanesulfonate monooxygenase SsuD/methylene tetrahydromethanopterin reductase-like flavin-dependent oxidoreductase (luciferase family)